MTVTTSNIVVPGPVIVYVGPASTALPANTVAKGTAWGGSWVDVGATMDGFTLSFKTEKFEVNIDQYNAPVKDFITGQGVEATFTVAEATLTNLKQALGYGTVTAGSTESSLAVGATVDTIPTSYAFGFECYAPGASTSNAWYRRFWIPIGSPREVGDTDGKKDAVQGVKYSVTALQDTTNGIWKVVDRVV